MTTLKHKHKGAANELRAILWLLNQGYEVFRNVSAHGAIDLIAIRDKEALLLDVKAGGATATKISDEQRELSVKILAPKQDIFEIQDLPLRLATLVCRCGKTFTQRRRDQQFCGKACKQEAWRRARGIPHRSPVGAQVGGGGVIPAPGRLPHPRPAAG